MVRQAVVGSLMAVVMAGSAAALDKTPPTPAGPLLENYKEWAERVIASALRDPYSAVYDYRDPPYILVCRRGVFGNKTPAEFWAAEVWVNAKNAFGGYTGSKPYTVVFIPDPVTDEVQMRAQVGLGGGEMVSRSGICRRTD